MIDFYMLGFTVFICGAVYEGSGVLWVHWAERNCAFCVGVISAIQALCQLTGIGASLSDHSYAIFFIMGYFLGPYCVIRAKRKGWLPNGH